MPRCCRERPRTYLSPLRNPYPRRVDNRSPPPTGRPAHCPARACEVEAILVISVSICIVIPCIAACIASSPVTAASGCWVVGVMWVGDDVDVWIRVVEGELDEGAVAVSSWPAGGRAAHIDAATLAREAKDILIKFVSSPISPPCRGICILEAGRCVWDGWKFTIAKGT